MNMRRTFAISRRIADLFRRDHRTLALVFVAPILILAMLGWVIADQKSPSTRMAVVNLAGDAGAHASELIGAAARAAGMSVRDDLASEQSARDALAEDQLDLAVILPASLPTDIGAGRSPTIVIISQGLNPAEDGSRAGQLQQAIFRALVGQAGQAAPTIEHQQVYGSPDATFLDAFAPALVGFIVFFLVFILTGISFLRERIGGTLERLLATPVRRSEIVVGYSLGFGIFATLQVAVVLAYTLGSVRIPEIGPLPAIDLGLGVQIIGSPWLAFVITLLLAISAVNLGIFISTFARTEFQILQFIPIVVVPQGLLSGIFWPVNSLPGVLEPIARVLPMTYGIEGLRAVLIKGSGLADPTVQLDLAVLAGVAIVLAVAATLTIRREVA
jgi:ABC-2 type transport system permease protein